VKSEKKKPSAKAQRRKARSKERKQKPNAKGQRHKERKEM
jgi:hypothetical protein